MGRCTPWCLVVVAALAAVGCCHVNRLREPGFSPGRVSFAVRITEGPGLHFSHESIKTRQVTGPSRSYSETQFGNVLAAFGPGGVAESLTRNAPGTLWSVLGWEATGEDGEPDMVLDMHIANYGLVAKDAVSEAEFRWHFRVVLTDERSGAILWRDCMEWSTGGIQASALQLDQVGPGRLHEILDMTATRILARLARHIDSEQR
jgi:hypothetical protein